MSVTRGCVVQLKHITHTHGTMTRLQVFSVTQITQCMALTHTSFYVSKWFSVSEQTEETERSCANSDKKAICSHTIMSRCLIKFKYLMHNITVSEKNQKATETTCCKSKDQHIFKYAIIEGKKQFRNILSVITDEQIYFFYLKLDVTSNPAIYSWIKHHLHMARYTPTTQSKPL